MHHRSSILVAAALFVAACSGQSEQSVCHDLCTELTATCSYEAFPNPESCEQGCEWNAEQGADVAGQLICVQSASCDTFAIMECEHTYGID